MAESREPQETTHADEPGADSVMAPAVDVSAPPDATPATPAPDLTRTGAALQTRQARSVGVTILAVLAVAYTLYFARAFLVPLVFAVLLKLLLSPVIRALARARIRPPAGAALVILGLLGIITAGAYELSGPAQGWIAAAPQAFATVGARLRKLERPVVQVTKTAEQVERATKVGGLAPSSEVVVKGPTLTSRLFGTTQSVLAAGLEILLLLYFLLAAGDLFLQKLVKVLPALSEKEVAVEIARATEASVSRYLVTSALTNLGEGVVITVVMWLLHMPNPELWGVLVAVLEFIPYLGAATMVAVLTLAGFTIFESTGHALAIPGSFLAVNLLWANVVSPLVLSRRLTLNPVAIFVGLAFWWWIWGIPGAFIAVPILATFKIFCDHIETLAPVGEFLGTRDTGERRALVR